MDDYLVAWRSRMSGSGGVCDQPTDPSINDRHGSSTLHQWSRDDPAFLLEEHGRKERGEKVARKPWWLYMLESVHKRDPYPDSKLAQLLLAAEINRLGKVYMDGWKG